MNRTLVIESINNLDFDTLRDLAPKLNVNHVAIPPTTPVIMVEFLVSLNLVPNYIPFEFSKHKIIDRPCLASLVSRTDSNYQHQMLKEMLNNTLNTQLFVDYVDAGFQLSSKMINDVYSVSTDTRYDLLIAKYFRKVRGVVKFLERASFGYDFKSLIDDSCYDKLIPKLNRKKMCMEGICSCLPSLLQGGFESYTVKEYNRKLEGSLSFDQYLRMLTITAEYSTILCRVDIIQIFDTIENKGQSDIGGCLNLIRVIVGRFRLNSLNYPFDNSVIGRGYRQIIELTAS